MMWQTRINSESCQTKKIARGHQRERERENGNHQKVFVHVPFVSVWANDLGNVHPEVYFARTVAELSGMRLRKMLDGQTDMQANTNEVKR